MTREWTDEQRQAASERMKQRNAAKKSGDAKARVRTPVGGHRDITAVKDTPDGYVDRWVNDIPGRIDKFKQAGYELVESASVGDSSVDGTHNESGNVSRDMGKGITAYLMRQRKDYYLEDQDAKQKVVDEIEESLRRDKNEDRNDGRYGEIKIN